MFFVECNGITLLKSHLLSQFDQIEHCFTTRRCNNSEFDMYCDKNLKLIAKVLKIEFDRLVYTKQVLGNGVIDVPARTYQESDGIITDRRRWHC